MVENIEEHVVASGPFKWGAATDKGKDRETNEDNFIIEAEAGLFLVADGMGGHRGGELASNIVAEDLSVMIETGLNRIRSKNPASMRRVLKKAIIEQNEHLKMEGESESGYKDMGATLVTLVIKDSRAYTANLGDSRLYRLRKEKFQQITKDHSIISELLSKGKIEEHEVEGHEEQGVITHYVGMQEKAEPFIKSFGLKKGDRLLLCSDGLTDMVEEKAINKIVSRENEPQQICDELIKAANQAGGHDNITVVIIDWSGRS
ncbi:MAG: Stp1/IreP family PP2C-type Ser/Thr phosphatase [Planctomycetota bacterium]|jgi:protein phosphatase